MLPVHAFTEASSRQSLGEAQPQHAGFPTAQHSGRTVQDLRTRAAAEGDAAGSAPVSWSMKADSTLRGSLLTAFRKTGLPLVAGCTREYMDTASWKPPGKLRRARPEARLRYALCLVKPGRLCKGGTASLTRPTLTWSLRA